MKSRWSILWTVAQREIQANIRTKGFWFSSVIAPVFIGLPLYVIWLLLGTLTDTIKDAEIDMSEIFEEVYVTEIDVVRNILWGDHLKYYVVDLTGQLNESIRQEILERELHLIYHGIGRIEATTMVEILEWADEHSSSFTMMPELSLHRFREVQDANVSFETLNAWLGTGQISGYFILPPEFLFSNESARFVRPGKLNRAQSKKLDELKLWFEDITTSARQDAILSMNNIGKDQQETNLNSFKIDIRREVPVVRTNSSATESAESARSSSVPLANWMKLSTIPFVYFFIVVVGSATNLVVTNTIEEKSSKVAELLVASATPSQLLDGKLLGNLVVVILPIVAFCVIIGPPLVAILGALAGYESPVFSTLLHPTKFLTWFLFLILGFTFFGYIQSALGSLCNDLKETMITLYPVQFIMMFGVLPAIVFVMVTPDGKLAHVLSFVPFFAPSVMVSRSAALPDWPVYLLILFVMCVSIFIVRKFSTTLFSHGMLSERAPSGIGSIFRFTRRPV